MKLGRALGYGTRHAARTLAAVAEAATTPAPAATRPPTPPLSGAAQHAGAAQPREAAHGAAVPRTQGEKPGKEARRAAGKQLLAPLATYSSALWLRVTGVFFAVIATVMLGGAWRLRGVLHGGASEKTELQHFWIFAGFALLFVYFAVSSFVRASRRERR